MYVFSNKGFSFHLVSDNYEVQTGEVCFKNFPSDEELEKVFAGYCKAKKMNEIQQKIEQIEIAYGMPRALRDLILKDNTHGAYDKAVECQTKIDELKGVE